MGAPKGRIPWNKGKKMSEAFRKKDSLSHFGLRSRLGAKLSDETKRKISLGNMGKPATRKGVHLSEETKSKISIARKGKFTKENSPCWKGGITSLRCQIWQTDEYKIWRKSVFERDDYTCLICGKVGGKINAHHIKPFSVILKQYNIRTVKEAIDCLELWIIDNGITHCSKCHYLKKKETRDKILNFQKHGSLK